MIKIPTYSSPLAIEYLCKALCYSVFCLFQIAMKKFAILGGNIITLQNFVDKKKYTDRKVNQWFPLEREYESETHQAKKKKTNMAASHTIICEVHLAQHVHVNNLVYNWTVYCTIIYITQFPHCLIRVVEKEVCSFRCVYIISLC